MTQLTGAFPGSTHSKACNGCDPREKCLKCKYLNENGGQCGGCHIFYMDEELQDDYIKDQLSIESASLRRDQE